MKTWISLSNVTLLPSSPHGLTLIHVPTDIPYQGIDFMSNVGVLIPFQEDKVVPPDVVRILDNFKPMGWDYAPERLRHVELLTLHVWALSGYHRDPQVIELLAEKGLKVKEVTVTGSQFLDLNQKPTYEPKVYSYPTAPSNPRVLYPRTRFLWAAHNKKFSEWERSFVTNIGHVLKANRAPSPKQLEQLNKLFAKYNVPLEAKASGLQ